MSAEKINWETKKEISLDIFDEERGRKGVMGEKLFEFYKNNILQKMDSRWVLYKVPNFFKRSIRTLFPKKEEFFIEDLKFLNETIRGEGPPTFDYVGWRKTNNQKQKVLMDLKTVTDPEESITVSFNQKKGIKPAQERGYEVWICKMVLSQDWKISAKISVLKS